MPRKLQIDRRRRRREVKPVLSSPNPPPEPTNEPLPSIQEAEAPSPEMESSENGSIENEEESAQPDPTSEHNDSSEPEEEKQESEEDEEEFEEPDNPDDEDFEMNESSSEEEEDDDFDNDSEPVRKRASPTTSRPSGKSHRRLPQFTTDSSEEEDDSALPTRSRRLRKRQQRHNYRDVGSDEEEGEPVSRAAKRSNRRTQFARDSDEEDEEEHTHRPSRSKRLRKRQQRHNYRDVGSDEEEEEAEDAPIPRATPGRASARRATRRLHELEKDEESQEEKMKLPMLSPKKKGGDSDSDEYVASNDKDEDEDDELSEAVSESLSEDNVQNVDKDHFYATDSSTSDNKVGPSPALDIRRQRRQVDDSDDDASLSEFQTTPGVSNPKRHRSSLAINCPSQEDAITMDPLPEKHVCFVAPDQQSRQCFALETLHKIAMTSEVRAERSGKRTLLQPPHFRTAISDDLLDQIASRFGRAALDLDGYFYNKHSKISLDNEEHPDYEVNFHGTLANPALFRDRFNNYMSHLMGHQDIYCCPLCYTEAYRRLVRPSEREDDESNDVEEDGEENVGAGFVFSQDPMTILGSVDDNGFELASTFCFTKIVEVKRHIRDDHKIDTSVLAGNELFFRFKIRAADGLLQRYIDKCHILAYQGSMRRYWDVGFNQEFLELLHLMKVTRSIRKRVTNTDDISEYAFIEEENKRRLVGAEVFLRSFENRGKRVWEKISAPYRKQSKKELDDFIVNDGVDEEESRAFARHPLQVEAEDSKMTPEDEIIAALQERRRERQRRSAAMNAEDSEDDSKSPERGDVVDDDESHSSDEIKDVQESSDSDVEDDEWVQKIRQRKPMRLPSAPTVAVESRSEPSSAKKHRHIVLSDDED